MQTAPRGVCVARLQDESADGNLEALPVDRHKEVAAMHDAVRGAQVAATGVLKGLARLEQRLLSDHPESLDLFGVALGVFDGPVAGDQLGRDASGVGDRDGVGKSVATRRGITLLRQVLRFGVDAKSVVAVGGGVGHGRMVTATIRA